MEPHLQPITGEFPTSASANFQDGVRLGVAADGFWESRFEVFNSYSNIRPQLSACYRSDETSKKRAYERRTLEFEHASFTPLIFSATGGLGKVGPHVHQRGSIRVAESQAGVRPVTGRPDNPARGLSRSASSSLIYS